MLFDKNSIGCAINHVVWKLSGENSIWHAKNDVEWKKG